MSSSINKVILIGRLGKDVELNHTSSGAPVAKFSLATEETFKDRAGEQQKRTEWHNVVAWNRLAEICGQYLTKGKQVYIEGSIRSRQWEDKGGEKRTAFEIVAREMKMLGDKLSNGTSQSDQKPTSRSSQARATANSGPKISDEDAPW